MSYIDEIKYNNIQHYVYYQALDYWLISKSEKGKLIYKVDVIDLELSAEQQGEQSKLIASRMEILSS